MQNFTCTETYDVIVVGGGHAGCEAAAAAARLGSKVLLLSLQIDGLAYMSCNPAMGGVAKGQIVREIDAMGGLSGLVTDAATIQFRMLNRSKGPAMWSPRAQCDMLQFSRLWRQKIDAVPNLDLRQDMVTGLWMDHGRLRGVVTRTGLQIEGRAVVLTAGTFLNGKIHIGECSYAGGRMGDAAATGLTESLQSLGFVSARLKTGTPVRIDGRTIDFSVLTPQPGDDQPAKFSFSDESRPVEHQLPCFLAYTDQAVHDILRTGFDKSPMYTGRIQGTGPRYCPSIEDKIVRFADKDRHQLFVEPMGRHTHEYYLNGFSSSLPEEVQCAALRRIKGFERAKIYRPGYAIEYDYFPPTQLKATLETKIVEHLYFAGQVNGTTGYEEAAGQGFMAGINAHLKLRGTEPFVLDRSQAYIGVLIDDLITKGVDEPYRMFTSRAEYRILLRQDNADTRLTPLAFRLGLADGKRMRDLERKQRFTARVDAFLRQTKIEPGEANPMLEACGTSAIPQKAALESLLQRPQVNLDALETAVPALQALLQTYAGESDYREMREAVEIGVKYESYIRKEQENAERMTRYEQLRLPEDTDYRAISSLSYEAREKLSKLRPMTIGQAARIPGVSPADISVLLIRLQAASKNAAAAPSQAEFTE
ncbi:MAG: tRNA uridine-5-carboxymethylaminomethyl(34) synthesis enzyme MnmG [Bacteroidales bacterium]|nr:tRNA uridine-5-carboxymethylaminomethyl(34) synthesis enzyme MnmG [Bacteroidales bacterium]MDE7103109.1 tRNA uridine-5-carboxymethylaminomethyl(34) synthesis enzyme MnmG [Bacteroidales bacterium]